MIALSIVFVSGCLVSVGVFTFYWGRLPEWFDLWFAPVLTMSVSAPYSARLSMEFLLGKLSVAEVIARPLSLTTAWVFWPLMLWALWHWVRRGGWPAFVGLVVLVALAASHWHFIAVAMMGV